MKKKTPESLIEEITRTPEEVDALSKEIASSMPREVGAPRKLTDGQVMDLKHLCAKGILNFQTRYECMYTLTEYLARQEIVVGEDVSESRLSQIYTEVKKALLNRTLGTVEEERDRYIRALARISARCEINQDETNALKAYKELADVAGVLDAKDDSKITINFLPATKKENG